jgi:DNA repair protein RadC
MVATLVEDAGADVGDLDVVQAAAKDARQIVHAVEAHYGEHVENLAAEYLEDADDRDELATFAYYLVMQSRGHGVAWSDDHEGELWTPEWDAAMWFVEDLGGVQYEPVGEQIDTPEVNPRRAKPLRVILPLGEFDDLLVKIALVRHPDWDKQEPVFISDPRQAFELIRSLKTLAQEAMYVILLDARNRVVGIQHVGSGGIASLVVDPRVVFQAAILSTASAMILVHNHPSGDPSPGPEDIDLTKKLRAAASTLGIKLFDHVVAGDDDFYSFADRGQLP